MAARRKKAPIRVQAIPKNLSDPYAKFATALRTARKDAESQARSTQNPAPVDVSQAIAVLNEYPQLRQYLQVVHEREEAIEEARAYPDDLLQKRTLQSPTASNSREPGAAVWGTASPSANNHAIGVMNARLLREWADTSEWTRAAINLRRVQIGRASVEVVPYDATKKYDKTIMRLVQLMLDQPNPNRDSWRSLIETVIEDILVLDRGVISKSMSLKRQPDALWAEDGATIKIYPAWSGDPKEPRYLFEDPAGNKKVPLRNDELIVIMANAATHRFGISPMAVLQNVIRSDLQASQSAMLMVQQKPPPTAIQLPGVSASVLAKIKENYDQNISGRKEMLFLGGPNAAQVFPLVFSAKDNQWLEWQEYLMRKICAVFQVTPQQLGVTSDVSKGTAQVMQTIYEDTGLIPLLLLLEEYLNRELLADFAEVDKEFSWRTDLAKLNLRILYPEVSEASRQYHNERTMDMAVKGLAGMPSMTLNQVLEMRGEERVPSGGNTFYMPIGQTVIPVASYDNDLGIYGGVMVGEGGGQGEGANGQTSLMRPPEPQAPKPGQRRVPKPLDADTQKPSDAAGAGKKKPPIPPAKKKSYQDRRPPGTLWSARYLKGEDD